MSGPSSDKDALRFMGRVSADISHEVTNVLAVLGELSGLLADLAAADRARRRPLSAEKVSMTAEKLSAQVDRGKDIVRHFNRFAHSMDLAVTPVLLDEAIERFAVLARRIAQRRRTEIVTAVGDVSVTMPLDAFALYRLLFDAFDRISEAYETVEISSVSCGDGAEILFRGTAHRSVSTTVPAMSPAGAGSIGGLDADVETTDDEIRIRLMHEAAAHCKE